MEKITYRIEMKIPAPHKGWGKWNLLHVSRTERAANNWLRKNSTNEDIWKHNKVFRIEKIEGPFSTTMHTLSKKALHDAVNKIAPRF
jgi:hypothetical protein